MSEYYDYNYWYKDLGKKTTIINLTPVIIRNKFVVDEDKF